MQENTTNFNPTQDILKLLDGLKKRTKTIIVKRFGLDGNDKMTLEAIGKNYKITRERVRQIEAAALKELKESKQINLIKQCETLLEELLMDHGKVMEHNYLLKGFGKRHELESMHNNTFEFVLNLSNKFNLIKENDELRKTWALTNASIDTPKKLINSFILNLEGKGRPVHQAKLISHLESEIKDSKTLISYLALSKKILKNPFNEWGLADWKEIAPKGIKDKAHIVLKKHTKPSHFTEITELINKAKFDTKTAIPQTVHNELIKDERFVLVGRGVYALTKWGYKQGTVAEIIAGYIKEANKPTSKEEIVDEVLKQRLVKKNTVLLALQNKEKFQKVNGMYALAQTL